MEKAKLTSRGIAVAVHAELQASYFRATTSSKRKKRILKTSKIDKAHHQATSIAKQGTGEEEPINR